MQPQIERTNERSFQEFTIQINMSCEEVKYLVKGQLAITGDLMQLDHEMTEDARNGMTLVCRLISDIVDQVPL